jgi:ribose 5-phosphate isomerase B
LKNQEEIQMKIAMGCDPNAEAFKKQLLPFVESLGHEVTDFGSDDPIYANVAIEVAEAVAAGKYDRGILFCGTGIGVMLAANKVKGAYAAVVSDVYSAQRACLSNNCNIITLGCQVTGNKLAEEVIRAYLAETYVYNERSGKKVDRIVEYEKAH